MNAIAMLRAGPAALLVALLCAAPAASARQPAAPSKAAAAPAPAPADTPAASVPADALPASYVLGPRDTVNVTVLGRTDYGGSVQVQPDGTVALPLIGSVAAANRTLPQLQADIQRRMVSGGFFVNPQVVVTLVTAASQYATLLGEVQSPGLVPLDHDYRLSELIARVGGVRPGTDVVTVTSPSGETREFSLRAMATNASPDPYVLPGTKVYVKPAQVFYIYGQVGSPGSYAIEDGMTVRNALARGGGLSQLGSSHKIKIFRGDQVIKNVALGTKLQAGDTIFVGERFF